MLGRRSSATSGVGLRGMERGAGAAVPVNSLVASTDARHLEEEADANDVQMGEVVMQPAGPAHVEDIPPWHMLPETVLVSIFQDLHDEDKALVRG